MSMLGILAAALLHWKAAWADCNNREAVEPQAGGAPGAGSGDDARTSSTEQSSLRYCEFQIGQDSQIRAYEIFKIP